MRRCLRLRGHGHSAAPPRPLLQFSRDELKPPHHGRDLRTVALLAGH